jgi:Flp pilus assembly protein TadG
MNRRPRVPSLPAEEPSQGSATLELVILAPAVLALLGLVILAARITSAGSAVEHAASAGARAASLERDARSARAAAADVVRQALDDQSITCEALSYTVDVQGFNVAIGQPATTSVSVMCRVPLADLGVPGMPGTRVIQGTATSSLDRFRGRS